MRNRKTRRGRGFTLIEALVTISIISVLAAVALPSFLRLQARSRQTEAQINLRAAFTTANAYFVEYDTYLTTFDEMGFVIDGLTWYNYLSGYAFPYDDGGVGKSKGKGKGVTCQNPKSAGHNPHCKVSEDGTSGTEFYGCVKPGCSSDYTSQVDACGAGGYSAIQTRTTFCFVAFGQIDTDPAIDVWTINMNGALNNGANDECAVKIEGLCARSYTARGGNDVDLLAN